MFHVDEPLPKVAFDKEVVVVAIAADSHPISIVAVLEEDGNLRIMASNDGLPHIRRMDFAYQIAVISRFDIKAIEGKPLQSH